MNILFTGASSFTGMWFARELAKAGHDVVATFRRQAHEYAEPIRRERVKRVLECCDGAFGCEFGDAEFLAVVRREHWDLVCHHAADVTNYKSPEFDVASALASNTRNISQVLEALAAHAGPRPSLLLTGSVFENDEGVGSEGLPAFSPYGLSKSFTHQVFRYHAARSGFRLGKFVIPNPFGPYEDARFTTYLISSWFAGRVATVSTPSYVRDNIHVSLLAAAYLEFASALAAGRAHACRPSGYAESQGAFAHRFAREMRPRLGLACALELKRQREFPEPRVRINTDVFDEEALGWSETAAWDDIAEYYKNAAA